jgi:hypothetical protein
VIVSLSLFPCWSDLVVAHTHFEFDISTIPSFDCISNRWWFKLGVGIFASVATAFLDALECRSDAALRLLGRRYILTPMLMIPAGKFQTSLECHQFYISRMKTYEDRSNLYS